MGRLLEARALRLQREDGSAEVLVESKTASLGRAELEG